MTVRQDNNIVERSLNHFALETLQYILCVVVVVVVFELHVTVSQILSGAQQCSHGQFMAPTTREAMYV
jgi:hypothetical protein